MLVEAMKGGVMDFAEKAFRDQDIISYCDFEEKRWFACKSLKALSP
ncbi:MAG: hypothetical protein JXN61_15370 [Sedimentisphaerales bacterium]|nr:hypothetical protein [Sedimentisphaerales bacterium]